jgi:hypothetical protein
MELLDLYWRSNHTDGKEQEELTRLAQEVIDDSQRGAENQQE